MRVALRPWWRRSVLHQCAASALAMLACACGSDGGAATGAAAPMMERVVGLELVRFDVRGVLTATPDQSLEVGVTIVGGDAEVLVYVDGSYDDASLSAGSIATHEGHGTVTLRTPSHAATFALRARLGDAEARLDVAVGAEGFGDVTATPTYLGHRSPSTLTASAFMGTTCSDLSKLPIADGAPIAGASASAPLTLQSVPAGTPLAVSVRSGHFARGCVDVASLEPGKTRQVKVPIYDAPIALEETDLHASYTFTPSPDAASKSGAALSAAASRALDAFLPEGAPESGALLDAMEALVPESARATWSERRAQLGWDAAVASWLSARPPSMRARASEWLSAAQAAASEKLVLHLVASPTADGIDAVVESWGLLGAPHTGLTADGAFDWTADADDTVHLSGRLVLLPSVLLTYAADLAAAKALAGTSGAASALAASIDCAGLGQALVGDGTSYPACGASCTGTLCGSALAAMWRAATDSSAANGDSVSFGMATSGHATVGDTANPIGFNGTWLGTATPAYGDAFALQGTATATR